MKISHLLLLIECDLQIHDLTGLLLPLSKWLSLTLEDLYNIFSLYNKQVPSDILHVDSRMPPLPGLLCLCPVVHCPHLAECCHLS